jgi:adenylate cyclase
MLVRHVVRTSEEGRVTVCGGCGAQPRDGARFCDLCGASLAVASAAEFKQVTVLFGDVVGSMDFAAAVTR